MKTALLVLSDPKSGSEQSLGSVFNALAVAHEHKEAGEEVQILFAGTGTRWPAELNQTAHPAHALYRAVVDKVAGLSCGCADLFGADDQGLPRLTDHPLAGTSGLPSVLTLQRQGWQVLTF
jgi:hypothetical protein